jgi:molybdenum-dependent DNA-binding transcriptional regulator ModE
LRESRGAQAIELLICWRRDRRRGGLAALTRFADQLLAEYRDREADRHAGRRGER